MGRVRAGPNLWHAENVFWTSMTSDEAGTPAPADFDDLFREHYWPMVRSLTVACGDREAAADAVQEAFMRAYTRWRRVSSYDSPAGWVRHVALNRLRDHFRRQARGQVALTRLAGRTTDVEAPTEPADDEVTTMLATLAPQQRIAAALFYVEELSVREVAESMHLSEGAVKYHLHAGAHGTAEPAGGIVSDDFGFEALDDELGRRLRGAAPPAGDAAAELATLRPRFERARRRRRTGLVSSGAAFVAATVAVIALVVGGSGGGSVRVPPATRPVGPATTTTTTAPATIPEPAGTGPSSTTSTPPGTGATTPTTVEDHGANRGGDGSGDAGSGSGGDSGSSGSGSGSGGSGSSGSSGISGKD